MPSLLSSSISSLLASFACLLASSPACVSWEKKHDSQLEADLAAAGHLSLPPSLPCLLSDASRLSGTHSLACSLLSGKPQPLNPELETAAADKKTRVLEQEVFNANKRIHELEEVSSLPVATLLVACTCAKRLLARHQAHRTTRGGALAPSLPCLPRVRMSDASLLHPGGGPRPLHRPPQVNASHGSVQCCMVFRVLTVSGAITLSLPLCRYCTGSGALL